jgi:hypothetical protein
MKILPIRIRIFLFVPTPSNRCIAGCWAKLRYDTEKLPELTRSKCLSVIFCGSEDRIFSYRDSLRRSNGGSRSKDSYERQANVYFEDDLVTRTCLIANDWFSWIKAQCVLVILSEMNVAMRTVSSPFGLSSEPKPIKWYSLSQVDNWQRSA